MPAAGVKRSSTAGRIGEGAAGFQGQLSKNGVPTDETPAVAEGDGSGDQVVGCAAKNHRHRAVGERVANLPQRIKKTVPARKFVFKPTWKTIE